jgi:hypothetical protein
MHIEAVFALLYLIFECKQAANPAKIAAPEDIHHVVFAGSPGSGSEHFNKCGFLCSSGAG